MRNRKAMFRPALFFSLLVLFLAAAGLSSAAEEVLYASDFSAGMDGWYPVGAGKVFVTPDQTLAVHERTQSWNCAYRDLPLAPGVPYHISTEVRQNDADTTLFMISVAHARNGEENSYENLAFKDVKKGEWTEVACEWTPGSFDTFSLYVETGAGYPMPDYELRNFRVTSGVSVSERFRQHFLDVSEESAPSYERLKALPIPDPLKSIEAGAVSWVIREERPVPVGLKEVTLEDNVLSVTLEAKVNNIYVAEISPRGNQVYVDYNSQHDRKNKKPKLNATVTLTDPRRNDVTVATSETKKLGKTKFFYGSTFFLNKKTLELEPGGTHFSHELSLKDFPPYDSLKKAAASYSVDFRPDGALSKALWSFEPDDFSSLQLTPELTEAEELRTLLVTRNCFTGYELFVSILLDTHGKPVSIDVQSPSDFGLIFSKSEDPSVIGEAKNAYPDLSLSEPGTSVWNISVLLMDTGWTELYFATRDDLFLPGEDGSLRLNTDALGLDGKPFPWPELACALDPQVLSVPVFR